MAKRLWMATVLVLALAASMLMSTPVQAQGEVTTTEEMTATESTTGTAEAGQGTAAPAADTPSVTASDQESDGNSVIVENVVAAQAGWMVIHADADGRPGPVLGQTPVAPGTTDNVVVILDEPIAGETPLWAMLHVDAGVRGTYEFPGADVPAMVDDAIVMAPFVATAPGGEVELMDLVDTAASNEQLSTLVAAVQAAGLVDALKGEGPYTLFAPTNEAFAALPQGTLDQLLADPAGDLSQILLYHVVSGRLTTADMTGGLEVVAQQGSPLTFSVDGEQVMVNDATVEVADIEATNGVLHVVDTVLMPPAEGAEAPAEAEPTATPAAEEEATPAAEEEAMATPAAEAEAEATATPAAEEATPAAEEEAAATPAAEEETPVTATPAPEGEGKGGAPGTLPPTGAEPAGAGTTFAVVVAVLLALTAGVLVRRRMA
jgi:uncharacterized surface protein with fasciclin (FAS1) repeats